MVTSIVGNMSIATDYFRIIVVILQPRNYLNSLYIVAAVGYPCACQKEEGREQSVEITLREGTGRLCWECHKLLYSLSPWVCVVLCQ